MNTLVSNSLPLTRQRPAALPAQLASATRTAIKLLQNIEGGSLRLVLPDGQPRGSKASAWKGGYHDGRAMLRCLELLTAMGVR